MAATSDADKLRFLPIGARKESTQDVGLLGDIHQKRVVAVVGFEIATGDVESAAAQHAYDFLGLIAGVEPVRGKADHEETRIVGGEGGLQRACAAGEVEVVLGLGDVKIRIGVEA